MLKSLCQKLVLKLDFECDTPLKFVTSQWQHGERSIAYVIYRFLYFVFYAFSFINSIVYSCRQNQLLLSLIYLTRWNLFATMVTALLATYYTTKHYRRKLNQGDRMCIGLKVYWFMYNNIPIYAIYISCIYWVLLYDGRSINLNNVLVHGTNFIGPLIDLLIVNHPYFVSHAIFPMICAVLYLTFSVFYQRFGGVNFYGQNFVYPILDWKNRTSIAMTVALSAIFCAGFFHIIFCAVALLRVKLHRALCSTDKDKKMEQMTKYHVIEFREI